MVHTSKLSFRLVLLGLSLLLPPVVAYAQSVIEKRGQIMEDTLEAAKAIRAAAKQKDYATVEAQAKQIVDNLSPGLLKLFPKDSLSDKSVAHPDIWVKWDEFGQQLEKTRGVAQALQTAAAAKDEAEVNAQVKALGGMSTGACGECHLSFNKKRMKTK
jgi:cytochrome c556